MTLNSSVYSLKELLVNKGYIRGPFGSSLKRGEMLPSGIPVYEQQNAIYDNRVFRYFISEKKFEEMKRFKVEPNDLVISCSGTVGKVTLIKEEDPVGIISQALLILRPNPTKVLPEYLYYFLQTEKGHNAIIERAAGSVQQNIARREIVESIQIELPNIEKQKAVVEVLKTFDDKISNNKKTIDNLMSQSLLVFENNFLRRESNGTIGEILLQNLKSKIQVGEAKDRVGRYPFYTSGQAILEYDSFLVDGENIFINTGGAFDVKFHIGKAAYSTDTWSVKGNNSFTYYLFILLLYHSVDFNLIYFEGSALKHLQKKKLLKHNIYIPSNKELDAFNIQIGAYLAKVEKNRKENKKLAEIKTVLLDKMIQN